MTGVKTAKTIEIARPVKRVERVKPVTIVKMLQAVVPLGPPDSSHF